MFTHDGFAGWNYWEHSPCALAVCLQPCNPLAPSCPQGTICDAHEGGFYCVAGPLAERPLNDSCYDGECGPGMFCDPYLFSPPPVEEQGPFERCQAYCDLGQPEMCPGYEKFVFECVPVFGEAEPPPGLEGVGRCSIPF